MKMKRNILILLIGLVLIVSGLVFVSAQYVGFSNYQSQADFQTYYRSDQITDYWPILGDKDSECRGRQDIILSVAPGGCQPMVVRSDLLADQNVPVLCQIDALQVNPLLDIKQIKNIRFSGAYPNEVATVGFHPARAALNTRDVLLGSPLINNIGYVVVVLKRNPIEKDLPDFVNVTLSAQLDYESGNALGIGRAEFVLSTIKDADWEKEKAKQSFWNGRYYLRLNAFDENFAYISIYDGDRVISSTKVKRGELSSNIYFPGSYCMASVQAEYSGFEAARDSAILKITDDRGTDTLEVYSGSRFYDNRCVVSKVEIDEANSENSENSDNSDIGKISLRCAGQSITLERNPAKGELPEDENIPTESRNAFDSAVAAYEKIADDYPAEKIKDVENNFIFVYYGEEALDKAITLARDFRQFAKEKELLEKTINLYPNSKSISEYRRWLSDLSVYDLTHATKIATVNNRVVTIQLSDFKKAESEPNATFSSGQFVGGEIFLEEGKEEKNKLGSVYSSIKLLKVSVDGADARVVCNVDGKTSTNLESFKLGDEKKICGHYIKLKGIGIKQVAKMKLIPKASYTNTVTNLSVTIGIEKRAIKLSPEKRKEMIQNLNESIEKWEGISKRLGNVVSGLKGACFVTTAALMVKNFISGISGNTLARQQAMTGVDGKSGWTKICQDKVSAGVSGSETMTKCYSKYAGDIENEVEDRAAAIKAVNERVAGVESSGDISQSSFLGGKSVNSDKAIVAYYNSLSQTKKDALSKYGITESSLTIGAMTYLDLRNLDYYLELQDKYSSQFADKEIIDITEKIAETGKAITNAEKAKTVFGVSAVPIGAIAQQQQSAKGPVLSVTEITSATAKISGKDAKVSGIPEGADAAMAVHGVKKENGALRGHDYIVIGKRSGNQLEPLAVYTYKPKPQDTDLMLTQTSYVGNNLGQFNLDYQISTFVDSGQALTGNKITDARSKEVIFFGSGSDKGLAQRVLFDLINGWYALVESSLDVGKNIKSYDGSGMPRSWYICNAGINRRVEDRGGDDECQLYIEGTGNIPILGLSIQKSTSLITKSRQALREANNQANNKLIKISSVSVPLTMGNPKSVFSGTECQQFMSAQDCNILFNICDPVICPTSRCDLGGNFPVSNVAQTGILGSILLCLPNAGLPQEGGVLIPVCLTGIQAGADAWVSILKNHRDCLQESLGSGRMTGICDEIYSFYVCDMFWKNIGPFANQIIPTLIQKAYSGGQGARGGAEYLTVQTAWDNMDQSINYFTQSYAANSFKLFQARSVAEIGGEICKGYISGKGPTDFKSLIESDSPPQFSAWFSSDKYSDATVPATAQYKVFYHIFAGKSAGVSYQIYLKNPPESPYYSTAQTVTVASGFIRQGEYASDAKDFTAPEGYRELCVRINNEDKCGFGQISTSYAVTTLTDSYVAGQAGQAGQAKETEGITSASDCISGTAGIAVNANPQALLEQSVFPQDYSRGIVRICATRNPAGSTDPNRYVEVGYCDNQQTICWLDKKSVSNAITDRGILNQTITALEQTQISTLETEGDVILTGDKAVAALKALSAKEKKLADKVSSTDKNVQDILTIVNNLEPKMFYNHHKARLILIKANVLGKIANYYLFSKIKPLTPTPSEESEESEELEEPGEIVDKISVSQINYQGALAFCGKFKFTESLTGTKQFACVKLSNSQIEISRRFGGCDTQSGEITTTTAQECVDKVNLLAKAKWTLSLDKGYHPSIQVNIISSSGEVTNLYTLNNKVYLISKTLGVDWLSGDEIVGTVSNNIIKILSAKKTIIGEEYYNYLNEAKISGMDITKD